MWSGCYFQPKSNYYIDDIMVNTWYRCVSSTDTNNPPLHADFDAMTSWSVLFSCLEGDVTRAGRDVKRHCPSLHNEISNTFCERTMMEIFFRIEDAKVTRSATVCRLCILCFCGGYRMCVWGGLTGIVVAGKTDGWLDG